MFRLIPLLSLVCAGSALGQERSASEPQELVFEDVYDVFSVIAFDTGELPSPGDPITVRFHITPAGGVVTGMEAESLLEWPTSSGLDLEHQVAGVPGTGFVAVDSEIEIAAEVGIDIFGLWSGTIDLWSEFVELYEHTEFDPLLLDGGEASVVLADPGLIDPIEYGITVFTGLEVVVAVAIYPELSATVAGARIETESDAGLAIQTADGQWTELPAPTVGTDELELDVRYVSELDAGLDLIIEPSVSLDTLIGGFQLLAFPIPVPLVGETGERVFPTQRAAHPLPLIGPLPASLDAGEVDLQGLVNLPVTLSNFGLLPLEGKATVVGSNDFSVFPDGIYIQPGGTDGLMVSFSPILEGERGVVLRLETNDPITPVIEIPIHGEGIGPELPDDSDRAPPDNGNVSGEDVKGGCGCSSGGAAPAAGWLGLGLLAGLVRRRGPVR